MGGLGHHDQRLVPIHPHAVDGLGDDGGLTPQAVLGVDDGRSSRTGQRGHGDTTESGGVGQVEVDDVEGALTDEGSQMKHPAQIRAPGRTQRMDRSPSVPDGGGEAVMGVEHIGHLALEGIPVHGGHGLHEEAFRSSEAEDLDDREDAEASMGPACCIVGHRIHGGSVQLLAYKWSGSPCAARGGSSQVGR